MYSASWHVLNFMACIDSHIQQKNGSMRLQSVVMSNRKQKMPENRAILGTPELKLALHALARGESALTSAGYRYIEVCVVGGKRCGATIR
jgi:hypothetical protein